jgi:hypothetical protein
MEVLHGDLYLFVLGGNGWFEHNSNGSILRSHAWGTELLSSPMEFSIAKPIIALKGTYFGCESKSKRLSRDPRVKLSDRHRFSEIKVQRRHPIETLAIRKLIQTLFCSSHKDFLIGYKRFIYFSFKLFQVRCIERHVLFLA